VVFGDGKWVGEEDEETLSVHARHMLPSQIRQPASSFRMFRIRVSFCVSSKLLKGRQACQHMWPRDAEIRLGT
jgi:hypothetical protein